MSKPKPPKVKLQVCFICKNEAVYIMSWKYMLCDSCMGNMWDAVGRKWVKSCTHNA